MLAYRILMATLVMSMVHALWMGPSRMSLMTTLALFTQRGLATKLAPFFVGILSSSGKTIQNNKIGVSEAGETGPLPVGLMNLRNTCYMNAILQSLFSIQQYSLTLVSGAYSFKKDSVGAELQKLFTNMQQASEKEVRLSILPLELAKKLRIDISQQEDAEELMLKILNEVDESVVGFGEGGEKKKGAKKVDKEVIRPSAALKMEMEQSITCVNVDNHVASRKSLTFFDLSVDIQGFKSLERAIDNHFVPELLSGDNRFRCAEHGLQDAEKRLTIQSFPRVLAVHLKRFSFDPATYTMKKVIDPMDIPLTLNMRSFASSSSSALKDHTAGIYELSAVVVHEGSLDVGHYYTYAKLLRVSSSSSSSKQEKPLVVDSDRSRWIKLNDQQVSLVSEAEVLQVSRGMKRSTLGGANSGLLRMLDPQDTSTNAYLLFYTQLD